MRLAAPFEGRLSRLRSDGVNLNAAGIILTTALSTIGDMKFDLDTVQRYFRRVGLDEANARLTSHSTTKSTPTRAPVC